MADLPDAPWGEPVFHASLQIKAIAACCVFMDDEGRVLLVKPTYKEAWEMPGGAVERDESPLQACTREVVEEVGLEPSNPRRVPLEKSRGDSVVF